MTRSFSATMNHSLVRTVIATGLTISIAAGCEPSSRYSGKHPPLPGNPLTTAEMQQDRPPTARTLFTLADILATQEKDHQCEFVLQRCIDQYPQFMPVYNSLAEVLMRGGRVSEAAAVLSNGLCIQPKDPVLLNNLGMCLMIRRQCDRALESFTKAAGQRPENRRYRANMAAALGLLGRQEESLSLLRQVLSEPQAEHNAHLLRDAAGKIPQSASPLSD